MTVVSFDGAQFSGGRVDFANARFLGGKVNFEFTEFSGSEVAFEFAEFSGGTVGFTHARFFGGEVYFGGAGFFSGTVGQQEAKTGADANQGACTSIQTPCSEAEARGFEPRKGANPNRISSAAP